MCLQHTPPPHSNQVTFVIYTHLFFHFYQINEGTWLAITTARTGFVNRIFLLEKIKFSMLYFTGTGNLRPVFKLIQSNTVWHCAYYRLNAWNSNKIILYNVVLSTRPITRVIIRFSMMVLKITGLAEYVLLNNSINECMVARLGFALEVIMPIFDRFKMKCTNCIVDCLSNSKYQPYNYCLCK